MIGPSGCGKSTFSRVVAGLDPYSSGEILVDGQPDYQPKSGAWHGVPGLYPVSMENRQGKCHVWSAHERPK